MSKEIYKIQCELVLEDKPNTKLVSWVLEKFAVAGKRITIDDKPEVWIVSTVGTVKRESSKLYEAEMAHRRYREHTDV